MVKKWHYPVVIAAVCLVLAGVGLFWFVESDSGEASGAAVNRLKLGDEETAKYLQGLEVVTMDQMELTLGEQSYPDGYISIPNHTEVLWKEKVTLPAGEGQLIKFVQGGSAVFPAPEVTYFWLCVQRPGTQAADDPVTYYVEAKVLGEDEDAAEANLLKLAEHWEVPD